ncbi:MAG: hypothetical protein ACRCVU_03055 [Flavobacterium sp.]
MEKEVLDFLKEFKVKLAILGVLYRDDRGKNTQALADLEISPTFRELILQNLELDDYSQGPFQENLYGGSDVGLR